MSDIDAVREKVRALGFWRGPVDPQPLTGGITNTNFRVEDDGRHFVVRVGADIPEHGILRTAELAASRAAHEAGVSPAVRHAEPGILVLDHIEGRTYAAEDVRADMERVAALVRQAHHGVQRHLRGPAPAFWVFHVVRDYAHRLIEARFRLGGEIPRYLDMAERLQAAVGPVDIVFGHNDLLPANFLDDGARLWLIDWDYGGFNSPLFDLGGLASNNGFSPEEAERLLALYFGAPPSEARRRAFQAMLTASLLREAMWSMVSEIHSSIDFDYRAYTHENLARFEAALAAFNEMDRR
ncbi:choline kinase family protein [Ancylobacter amanitiformis]|uniref:Thiamine kinase-like enzyme n=1 Tax=Ancylobacter amanitiformis TaxID=217069 RepID=A0ABU0LMC1_9HYPH|nr:choline kinase family protein [Ancylobacter amanitiformis]MDQ0509844.1 thiamine kinase-like enzyme [Ancylobacter amanitiformis]